jgi:methylthioribose-1-phosphate isomerase
VTADLPVPPVLPLAWQGDAEDGTLALLDQTLLPGRELVLLRRTTAEVVDDIRRLAVRGAPLLGLAGAYGLVLAAREARDDAQLRAKADSLARARPTAVNLARAVKGALADARVRSAPPPRRGAVLLEIARRLEAEERAACDAIARHGALALGGLRRVLTHCNAGALVTPGLGTALAPLYALHHRGARIHVWVDETRPLLQGLRLTAYELGKAGVPHAVLADGAAAGLMRRGLVDAAIVGADRVCANGDVVNKVGTYGVALACRHHGVPFFVAAPRSTFDAATPTGAEVEIEERVGDGTRYLAPGTAVADSPTTEPAFDVTPAALVSAFVTPLGTFAPTELPPALFA